jgi:hypothetical protein
MSVEARAWYLSVASRKPTMTFASSTTSAILERVAVFDGVSAEADDATRAPQVLPRDATDARFSARRVASCYDHAFPIFGRKRDEAVYKSLQRVDLVEQFLPGSLTSFGVWDRRRALY